jgi:recombination endonuclease VII
MPSKDPIRRAEVAKKYYQSEKGKATAKARYYKYKDKYKHNKKKYTLKYKYGMTLETFNNFKNLQNNKCICGRESQYLNVDHNHTTGLIRGLLCFKCNRLIGLSGDSPEILKRLADYLEATDGKQVRSTC